ncbi:hypothetical protein IMZ11_33675 [Microtetraspora sp. AC03309]|uniref:hypothetical protein n=1 Tax=Microtetraspora sp. AC03309 TaxID=2779376 RepID=UPI001E3C198A|nr:hypothetical protein [Microtetraspora sp. AC03309]MCC5580579.1 hypothetical protein [Microtetraspora sp. AC03309]
MSTAADEAARLRAQADALERVGTLTEELETARAAWLKNKTPKAKAAYRAAAQALEAAREEHATTATAVISEPGSVTITPGGVAVQGGAN